MEFPVFCEFEFFLHFSKAKWILCTQLSLRKVSKKEKRILFYSSFFSYFRKAEIQIFYGFENSKNFQFSLLFPGSGCTKMTKMLLFLKPKNGQEWCSSSWEWKSELRGRIHFLSFLVDACKHCAHHLHLHREPESKGPERPGSSSSRKGACPLVCRNSPQFAIKFN